MINEAYFSVTGYVATEPRFQFTVGGVPTLSMRVGWTPRRRDPATGDWADQPSSFATVTCFRKVAENAAACLRKGDPILVKGTLRIREFQDQDGGRRNSVEVVADSVGHDISRGTSTFTRSHTQLTRTALERWREEHMPDIKPQPDGVAADDAEPDGDAASDRYLAGAGPAGAESEETGTGLPDGLGRREAGGADVALSGDQERVDPEEAIDVLATESASAEATA